MRPLHVERRLLRPADHVGVGRIERRDVTGGMDDRQLRIGADHRISRDARAGRRVRERLIEHVQVVHDRRRPERVHDRDRLTRAVNPDTVQRRKVVRPLELARRVAMDPDHGNTARGGHRSRPGLVADRPAQRGLHRDRTCLRRDPTPERRRDRRHGDDRGDHEQRSRAFPAGHYLSLPWTTDEPHGRVLIPGRLPCLQEHTERSQAVLAQPSRPFSRNHAASRTRARTASPTEETSKS